MHYWHSNEIQSENINSTNVIFFIRKSHSIIKYAQKQVFILQIKGPIVNSNATNASKELSSTKLLQCLRDYSGVAAPKHKDVQNNEL